MQYRAIIKKSEGWWIGWLVDLPGVNAQERTKGEVIKSLKIGAEDMLATEVSFKRDEGRVLNIKYSRIEPGSR